MADGATPAAACFHCGDALPAAAPQQQLDGRLQSFCCRGCAAASVWIAETGLGDYYRLRSETAKRVGEEALDYTAWDRDDVLREHSRSIDDQREITLIVEGMRCAACAWLINHALASIEGVVEVSASAASARLRLRWRPHDVPLSSVLHRLASLGFQPHLAPGEALERERSAERRQMILRLGVALIGTVQSMMFAEALYLDVNQTMAPATRDFMRWVALLLATPVVFYSGAPFLRGMLREWRLRRLGMDTLIASSVLMAFFGSLIETLRGGPHVWIDAAVMFVLLLLAARAVELFARQRANATVDQLARARPALAWRIGSDERVTQVPVRELACGDLLRVAQGEAVAADGRLLDGGEFDESLLSGESRPRVRRTGDIALAGSHCVVGPVRIEITRTGQDTRLSHLVRLVDEARTQRPRIARLADSIANRLVSGILLLTLVAGFIWWQVAPERVFEIVLGMLVISCPCALSLAVPAALGAAHSALSRIGVLALGADALEQLAKVDVILLDKTGTLTKGQPEVTDVRSFAADWNSEGTSSSALFATDPMTLAAALQTGSRHPLAQAFLSYRDAALRWNVEANRTVVGLGVEARVDGQLLRLGRADFAAGQNDDGALWLGDGSRALARFELTDTLRIDALSSVQQLNDRGIKMELLSGDGQSSVAHAAASLGIEHWRSRQSPEAKLARLLELQGQGHCVAMLGDGINDAPVLAGADVSIAMGGGTSMAHHSADLVLLGDSLDRIPQAIVIARRTRSVIRQNLAWAGAYNLLAVPAAALGAVTPWMAALGMAMSSLLVTLNSLRLVRMQTRHPDSPGASQRKSPSVA